MNGFGVGAAVAIGVEIGATIVEPNLDLNYVLMFMIVYGAFIGYIFQVWRMALTGVSLASFAGRGRRSSAVVLRFLRTLFSRGRSP